MTRLRAFFWLLGLALFPPSSLAQPKGAGGPVGRDVPIIGVRGLKTYTGWGPGTKIDGIFSGGSLPGILESRRPRHNLNVLIYARDWEHASKLYREWALSGRKTHALDFYKITRQDLEGERD